MKLFFRIPLAMMFLASDQLYATDFVYISGNTTAPYNATIDASGNLVEDGITYPVVYKPLPQPSWVRTPWISPSQWFPGEEHAIGMEIDQTENPASDLTDKVNLTVCNGDQSFAPTFSNKRYLGMAVEFPQDHFQTPSEGSSSVPSAEIFAQFWQGSPYHPPVSLRIGGTDANGVDVQVWLFNDQTGGDPSASPIIYDAGTVPWGWNTFVLMVIPDYTGAGQVKLWVNSTLIIDEEGIYVGYNPDSTGAYNFGSGTPVEPNPAMNVYFGPYRVQQETTQQFFFDEIRLTDTYTEAVPGSGVLPD
jgi:hypothetical protein